MDNSGMDSFPIYETISESAKMSMQRSSTRQSLNAKFERESQVKRNEKENNTSQLTRSGGSWCEGFSLQIPSVNPRQALRSGAEKLSQTLNTVRTTFGTLSQVNKLNIQQQQKKKEMVMSSLKIFFSSLETKEIHKKAPAFKKY